MSILSSLLPEGVSDPYALLGILKNATPRDIQKAYRRKARDTHPDKNPNDPNAEVNFRLLYAAFEFLEDAKKRSEYDQYLRKESERRERFLKQTSEKRKFAEDLEKRELEANASHVEKPPSAEQQRKELLRRSREENEKWLSTHHARKAQDTHASQADFIPAADGIGASSSTQTPSQASFVEAAWDPSKSMTALGVTQSSLHFQLSRFGNPVIRSFNPQIGKAIIELPNRESAVEATLYNLQSRSKVHFTLKLLKKEPKTKFVRHESQAKSVAPVSTCSKEPSSLVEFELDVLRRLQEAAKKQKA